MLAVLGEDLERAFPPGFHLALGADVGRLQYPYQGSGGVGLSLQIVVDLGLALGMSQLQSLGDISVKLVHPVKEVLCIFTRPLREAGGALQKVVPAKQDVVRRIASWTSRVMMDFEGPGKGFSPVDTKLQVELFDDG